MRSEAQIISLIIDTANSNDKIRAVLLNGSRVNDLVEKDNLQDFDIVYLVNDIDFFIFNPNWIDIFGERLLLQTPDNMTTGGVNENSFTYLMLFKDGNRIDLTLFPINKFETDFHRDSLTKVLLDKDNLCTQFPEPNISDYLIKKPNQKEFSDCCNEFWWVRTYIVKGLIRNEITYAKYIMENPVRKMFDLMMAWFVGVDTNFSVSIGYKNRFLENFVSKEFYNKVMLTYPDSKVDNIVKSLIVMTELFDNMAQEISTKLDFYYNRVEAKNSILYPVGQNMKSNTKIKFITKNV